jgi:hypothetical protein
MDQTGVLAGILAGVLTFIGFGRRRRRRTR